MWKTEGLTHQIHSCLPLQAKECKAQLSAIKMRRWTERTQDISKYSSKSQCSQRHKGSSHCEHLQGARKKAWGEGAKKQGLLQQARGRTHYNLEKSDSATPCYNACVACEWGSRFHAQQQTHREVCLDGEVDFNSTEWEAGSSLRKAQGFHLGTKSGVTCTRDHDSLVRMERLDPWTTCSQVEGVPQWCWWRRAW